MNLFKKTTASVALVALVSGTFSTGVAAMDLAEINAATSLAKKGFINEVETVADFRLDATITRAEAAKVAAMIAGVTPNDSCEGKFTDVSATTPNDWVCGYVEALLEEGLLSANAEYNPERNLSKTESLKMMMEAAGEEVEYGNDWQADFVAHAVEAGYISTFADFNTAATRGFVFVAADNSHTANDEGDLLEDILDQL
ncbi:MAG: S-layer homology domain-containing protein, partial [Patescibacteria group bacterium]